MEKLPKRFVYDIDGNPVEAVVQITPVKPRRNLIEIFSGKKKEDVSLSTIVLNQPGKTFDLLKLRSGEAVENIPRGSYQVYLGAANQSGINGCYIYPDDYPQGSVAIDKGIEGIETIGDFLYDAIFYSVTIGGSFSFQVTARIPFIAPGEVIPNSYFKPQEVTLNNITVIKIAPAEIY